MISWKCILGSDGRDVIMVLAAAPTLAIWLLHCLILGIMLAILIMPLGVIRIGLSITERIETGTKRGRGAWLMKLRSLKTLICPSSCKKFSINLSRLLLNVWSATIWCEDLHPFGLARVAILFFIWIAPTSGLMLLLLWTCGKINLQVERNSCLDPILNCT